MLPLLGHRPPFFGRSTSFLTALTAGRLYIGSAVADAAAFACKIGPVHNLLHHVVETVTLGLVLAEGKERKSIVFGLRYFLENVEPENCSEHCPLDFSGF